MTGASMVTTALGNDFLRDSLGKAVVHRPSALKQPARIFSLVDVARIATTRRLEPPQMRVFRSGTEVEHNRWLRRRVSRRQVAYREPAWGELEDVLAEGATLIIDAVDQLDQGIGQLAHELSWWVRERVQVNSYASFGLDSQGFDAHWDDHDVIVIQLEGRKRWRVYGPSRPFPMYRDTRHDDNCPERVLWQSTLQPGDVLHVPRGWWHDAVAADRLSLHLTAGFTRRTGIDWIVWLSDLLRADPSFREDLPRFAGIDEIDGFHMRLVEGLTRCAEQSSVAQFLVEHAAAAEPLVALNFPIVEPDMAKAVKFLSPVPPEIRENDRTVVLESCGKRLTFHIKAARFLRRVAQPAPIGLEQLLQDSGLSQKQAGEVLRALAQARLILLVQ